MSVTLRFDVGLTRPTLVNVTTVTRLASLSGPFDTQAETALALAKGANASVLEVDATGVGCAFAEHLEATILRRNLPYEVSRVYR